MKLAENIADSLVQGLVHHRIVYIACLERRDLFFCRFRGGGCRAVCLVLFSQFVKQRFQFFLGRFCFCLRGSSGRCLIRAGCLRAYLIEKGFQFVFRWFCVRCSRFGRFVPAGFGLFTLFVCNLVKQRFQFVSH